MSNEILLLGVGALGFAAIAALGSTFFTVTQRTTAIVQRFGKFVREAGPGLHVKIPFIDRVTDRVNLRVMQREVEIAAEGESKQLVRMMVAVQYYGLPEKIYGVFYRFDVVSVRVSRLELVSQTERPGSSMDEPAETDEVYESGWVPLPGCTMASDESPQAGAWLAALAVADLLQRARSHNNQWS